MCGLRVQLLNIILSIALCLAVREQQQQLLFTEQEDGVDNTVMEKRRLDRLDEE